VVRTIDLHVGDAGLIPRSLDLLCINCPYFKTKIDKKKSRRNR
jgi:hypothetical protein